MNIVSQYIKKLQKIALHHNLKR